MQRSLYTVPLLAPTVIKTPNIDYKIEVLLSPDPSANPTPYFWCLFGFHHCTNGDAWCNDGCGWSVTPTDAWNDALAYYQKHYSKE